jgi:hypothetical protein
VTTPLANIPTEAADRFWRKLDKDGPVHPVLGTQCWVWTASLVGRYGGFVIGGRLTKAHRVAWALTHDDPGSMHVLHRCDNPLCARPDHLFVGTQLDNVRDMDAKGRRVTPWGAKGVGNPERLARGDRHGQRTKPESAPRGERNGNYTKPDRRPRGERNGTATRPERRPRGERNGKARLTTGLVIDIRIAHAAGQSVPDLARLHGVGHETVRDVVQGRTWRHVRIPDGVTASAAGLVRE